MKAKIITALLMFFDVILITAIIWFCGIGFYLIYGIVATIILNLVDHRLFVYYYMWLVLKAQSPLTEPQGLTDLIKFNLKKDIVSICVWPVYIGTYLVFRNTLCREMEANQPKKSQ